jgi:uncharacterized protein (DUF2461 family)
VQFSSKDGISQFSLKKHVMFQKNKMPEAEWLDATLAFGNRRISKGKSQE